MANINYTKPNKLENFSVWCSKKYPLWCKSNFPFIEDTFEALDTYGLICKIVQYLNETKQNLNTTEDNVQNIYDFVSNYFDNLDVQNEINNKLDSMVSSGELQTLLTEQYNALRNEVNSQINIISTEQIELNNRMNEFTSLPEGSTSADAELIDIRVGSNNKTYPSAGDSVRGQVSQIFQPIYKEGSYLSLYSGNTVDNQGWTTLISYIPVIALKEIKLKTFFNVGSICFYKGDKTFISAIHPEEGESQVNSIEEIIIPENAVYFRLCYFWNDTDFNIVINNVISYLFEEYSKIYNDLSFITNNIFSIKKDNNPLRLFYQFDFYTSYNQGQTINFGMLENNFSENIENIYLYAKVTGEDKFDILKILDNNGIIELTLTKNYELFRIFVNLKETATYNGEIVAILNEKIFNNNIYNLILRNAINSENNYTVLKNKIIEINNKIRTQKILDISGNGDFTDFNSACDYCNSNNCDLIIKPGIYNISNFNNKYINFNIFGYTGAKIIANYTGTDENIIKNYSPINFARIENSDVEINNVDIEVTNCRYGIHDEMGQISNYRHKIKNCKIKHNSESNSVWATPRAIGGGVGNNGIIEIDNCELSCKLLSACDYHTGFDLQNNEESKSSKVYIKNCYSEDSTISATSLNGADNLKNEMYVSNCYLKNEPFMSKDNESISDNFILKKWNNEII